MAGIMHLVRAPLITADPALPEVAVPADRRQLAKRRWRAAAVDGTEFGFELESPLEPGDGVWASAEARYVVRQSAEPVLAIPLDLAPDAAAVTGWVVGNLHFPIEAQPARLLVPDERALRRMLERLGVPYRESIEVFRPHRLTGVLIGAGQASDHVHVRQP
jgi:urease accessory protein